MAYIEMKNSYKRYKSGQSEIIANNDISFEIEKGELAIILGSSGAGKSTVLNILGGMDTNDEGNVLIDGKDISTFNEKELTNYRRNDVGFVFQFYNLVPNLTAKENVELASEIVKEHSMQQKSYNQLDLEKESTTFQHNYPEESNNVSQSHVQLRKIPSYFCVTNQLELSIIIQASKF